MFAVLVKKSKRNGFGDYRLPSSSISSVFKKLSFLILPPSTCWNGPDFDSDGVNATGRSGGLLSIWNKELFVKSEVIKNKNFLIIVGNWKRIDDKLIFAKIYGPHAISNKNAL